MAFGLTATGLEIKRLADIKPEIEDILRQRLGNSINLFPEAVFGQIVGTFSERESEIWEKVEDVYHSQYPDDAEGASLDSAGLAEHVKQHLAAYKAPREMFVVDVIPRTAAGKIDHKACVSIVQAIVIRSASGEQ